jgi:hypothetical protein
VILASASSRKRISRDLQAAAQAIGFAVPECPDRNVFFDLRIEMRPNFFPWQLSASVVKTSRKFLAKADKIHQYSGLIHGEHRSSATESGHEFVSFVMSVAWDSDRDEKSISYKTLMAQKLISERLETWWKRPLMELGNNGKSKTLSAGSCANGDQSESLSRIPLLPHYLVAEAATRYRSKTLPTKLMGRFLLLSVPEVGNVKSPREKHNGGWMGLG